MARIARVVAPGLPHHATQQGNCRHETFFCEEDYQGYIHLMAECCSRWHVEVWAYWLMPNYIHMITVLESEEGLRQAMEEAHRRYTINFREGWQGHLWQGRFASFPMDELYLLATTRYVELNPVQAGLVKVKPLLEMAGNWKEILLCGVSEEEIEKMRRHEKTGRPLGSDGFVHKLEEALGRILQRRKPRRKRTLQEK